jgi:hypothetical protein
MNELFIVCMADQHLAEEPNAFFTLGSYLILYKCAMILFLGFPVGPSRKT